MPSFARFRLLAAALALALSAGAAAATRGDDAGPATTGTLTGKVVDQDGNPAAGARVSALQFDDLRAGRKDGAKAGSNDGMADTQPARHPDPVATVETGKDGAFTIAGVPAGKYALLAVLRGSGRGRIKGPLEVTAGQGTDAGTVTLAPRGGKKAGGKKGAAGAAGRQP